MGRDLALRRRFDVPYLTDGTKLYEVCGARNGVMLLKDSSKPNDPVISRTAAELKGLRTVRPN